MLIVAGAFAALLRPVPEAEYTLTPIGGTLGWGSYAVDVNARGDVLGHADGMKDGRTAFIQRGTDIEWLPAHSPPLMPRGFNDHGAVIGSIWTIGKPQVATFLWRNGVLSTLTIDGRLNSLSGINDRGQIAGVVVLRPGTRPFVWRDGKVEYLPAPPAAPTGGNVTAINATGDVAGYVEDGTGFRAVTWRNGQVKALPMPAATDASAAAALNDSGLVTGWYRPAGKNFRGFVWNGHRSVDLGSLGGDVLPNDINNRGEVVGAAEVHGTLRYDGGFRFDFWRGLRFDWPHRAFLWRNGRMLDLNALIPPNSGWLLEEANAINDAGQIAGTGTCNGQKRGFLLTPIAAGRP